MVRAGLRILGAEPLSSCAGNTVWLYAMNGSGEGFPLQGHNDLVTLLAVDDSSQWLASGSWDKTVRLWPLTNPERGEYTLRRHVSDIIDIEFSPDGTKLATTEGNSEVLVWDISNLYKPPLSLRANVSVAAVTFGPEGQKVIALLNDGGVMVWDLNVENLVKLGCRLAGRTLSEYEWNSCFPNLQYSPRCIP